MANLYLYYYVRDPLLPTKERDLRKAHIFLNIFKVIYDLCIFTKEKFENNCNDIYSDELKLKKKNEDPCKVSFVDLSTEVCDKQYTTELFDKRDLFPFYINRMPYLDENIPAKIFYASVGPKFLHQDNNNKFD